MNRFLWICMGGAAGTGARYLVSSWIPRVLGASFPWGTLTVNLLGSFLLSVVMRVAITTDLISPPLRLVLTTGVMGGFTTYSTFNYETLEYFEEGAWGIGTLNVAATVALCLAGGLLGRAVGRWLAGA